MHELSSCKTGIIWGVNMEIRLRTTPNYLRIVVLDHADNEKYKLTITSAKLFVPVLYLSTSVNCKMFQMKLGRILLSQLVSFQNFDDIKRFLQKKDAVIHYRATEVKLHHIGIGVTAYMTDTLVVGKNLPSRICAVILTDNALSGANFKNLNKIANNKYTDVTFYEIGSR